MKCTAPTRPGSLQDCIGCSGSFLLDKPGLQDFHRRIVESGSATHFHRFWGKFQNPPKMSTHLYKDLYCIFRAVRWRVHVRPHRTLRNSNMFLFALFLRHCKWRYTVQSRSIVKKLKRKQERRNEKSQDHSRQQLN